MNQSVFLPFLALLLIVSTTRSIAQAESQEDPLRLVKRETGKVREIPHSSVLLIKTETEEFVGRYTGLDDGRLTIDIDGGPRSFHVNDIRSLGHRTKGHLLKGIGIVTLGTGMLAGGLINATSVNEPALGIMGVVAGIAVISMSPSVFKYGKRYHLDGEWMAAREDRDPNN